MGTACSPALGLSLLLASAAATSTAGASSITPPPLNFLQSADGRSFHIRSARGEEWLSSAGPQLNKTLLRPVRQTQPKGSFTAPRESKGRDVLGTFVATAVDFTLPGGAVLTATTRVYDPATSPGNLVVVFEQEINRTMSGGLALGSAISSAQREVSLAWPTFKQTAAGEPAPPPAPPAPTNCSLFENTDFNGGDFQRLTGVASAEDCCRLCTQSFECAVFVWYIEARSGTTGNGPTEHCNLKSKLVKKLTDQANHTAGICHSHSSHHTNGGPELNAFTTWGPSGMFNEVTRLWSPGALMNTASCGGAGNDKGCDSMGPLVVYDRNMTSLVVAPLDEFMVHAIAAGIEHRKPVCSHLCIVVASIVLDCNRVLLMLLRSHRLQTQTRSVLVYVVPLRPCPRASSCPPSWLVVRALRRRCESGAGWHY